MATTDPNAWDYDPSPLFCNCPTADVTSYGMCRGCGSLAATHIHPNVAAAARRKGIAAGEAA
jgi:hypothetical protein